jgi:hypothetical protein
MRRRAYWQIEMERFEFDDRLKCFRRHRQSCDHGVGQALWLVEEPLKAADGWSEADVGWTVLVMLLALLESSRLMD